MEDKRLRPVKAAACLIVRNEEDNILEWLAHYATIGFTKVVVYDNGSIDQTKMLCLKFAAHYDCEVHTLTPDTHDPQIDAYNDCISRLKDSYDWISFFDIDEFLISQGENSNIVDSLSKFVDASALCINWLTFGSNGIIDKGTNFVMEAFTRRGALDYGLNQHVKTIVRPSQVSALCNNPHWFPVAGRMVSFTGDDIEWVPYQAGIVPHDKIVHADWRLHHYYTRGRKDWEKRMSRGQFGGLTVAADAFVVHDRNEFDDTSALASADRARRLLQSFNLL